MIWVQEEPLNMGAAAYLQMHLKSMNYGIISRQPSAATASGYSKVHAQEQNEIVETAFSIWYADMQMCQWRDDWKL